MSVPWDFGGIHAGACAQAYIHTHRLRGEHTGQVRPTRLIPGHSSLEQGDRKWENEAEFCLW